jgi:hypothetical protein
MSLRCCAYCLAKEMTDKKIVFSPSFPWRVLESEAKYLLLDSVEFLIRSDYQME